MPITIYVYVIEDAEILDAIVKFNQETGNTNIGKIDFEKFLTKEVIFSVEN